MNKKIESDEIDLIEVIINIWNNKLKIATITFIFITLSIALHFIIKPQLTAKTEILPITIFEDNLYSQYNFLVAPQKESDKEKIFSQQRFNKINKEYLLDLFLEELKFKDIIIKAIINYQILSQKKFDNEEEYLKAIRKKVLKLNLLRPISIKDNIRDENWTIEFETHDEKKWEEALNFIEDEINNNIKEKLILDFNATLNNLKLLNQYKLQDLDQQIKNVKNDYNTETNNRLAFLREQALIARKLNIKNNTLEVENFSTQSGVISNLQTAKPYYMRGYSMIEKEIELIETRTNKDAFTKNLFDLEKQRRDLIESKLLERLQKLFDSIPVNDNNFKAANIFYQDTEYEASFSLIKVILYAGIFGIIFGMLHVLILNSIKMKK